MDRLSVFMVDCSNKHMFVSSTIYVPGVYLIKYLSICSEFYVSSFKPDNIHSLC